MSAVVIAGDTSGTVTLQAPAVSGTTTLTLPTTNGTVLTSASSLTASQLPTGSVLQVVNYSFGTYTNTTAQIPIDNTIPQNTEGTELMTVSITPTSSSNKLIIDVLVNSCNDNSGRSQTIALFQDSTANALNASWAYQPSGGTVPMSQMIIKHYMTAGTTSSTTFKVRYGPSSLTTFAVNGDGSQKYGGVFISSITVTEVKG